MDHNLGIVFILTVGFALASCFAYITEYLKLSPIPGYLFAGFIIGPYSPGYVADSAIAEQLAEIGVILMLFGVGLHFKLEDLINVKNIALPGAAGQTLVATLVSTAIVYAAGWPLEMGVIVGLAIGVASTVVLVRVLTDNHLLNTPEGYVAVGWLVVEDIFTVIILIMLPTFADLVHGETFSLSGLAMSLVGVVVKFSLLFLLMFTWGHRIVAYILLHVARLRSHEMFTLAVLALVLLIAMGSTVIFGTSIALGAFIAGMVIGKTNVRHQAAANALPLKDIFSIIFFLSVGMIFNPEALVTNFPLFLGLLATILIIKPLTAYLIAIFLGYSIKIALTVALALAQIGEFSFILAEQGLKLQLVSDEGYDLLVACALLSISLNPLFFRYLGFFESLLTKITIFNRFKSPASKDVPPQKKTDPKVIVIGFGPIGKAITSLLEELSFEVLVIEHNIDTVSIQEEHGSIIFGDATTGQILKDAQIDEASHLIITIPDTDKAIEIIRAAREVNPKIKIIARVRYIAERHLMDELHVQCVCTEKEALKAMTALIHPIFSLRSIHLMSNQ